MSFPMVRPLCAVVLAALVTPSLQGQLDQERTWTGKNGKTFRGKFPYAFDPPRNPSIQSGPSPTAPTERALR
jgi:hypothetical protein